MVFQSLVRVVLCGWAETINQAGMQRTLSQMMAKEFLLTSRGTSFNLHKSKLLQSMQNFNSTLHALRIGDPQRGIIASPNSQVSSRLDAVEAVWAPMEQLLRSNIGSLDMMVLNDLSQQNLPLQDASNGVVQALVNAARVSGASTNGLVQDIAGRQRTLIQRMAKEILFLAQGVQMSFNMRAYAETKTLFEESHHGIIEGVPFVGLPVLDELCTIHKMSEVSYFYAQLRPLLTGINNAETPSKSQAAARAVVDQVVELVDPLYFTMVDAVELYGQSNLSCDPRSWMMPEDWRTFFSTVGLQQLWTQQAGQYFIQVALKIDVKHSQVEITVLKSEATLNLRNLIEGNKMLGIPPPPSQRVLQHLLKAAEIWKILDMELDEGIHKDRISEVTLERVEVLSHNVLHELEEVMKESLPLVVNTTVPAYAMTLSDSLARYASMITEEAILVHHDHDVQNNWEHLNHSREAFYSNRWSLLRGEDATDSTPRIDRVADVCIVQQMKSGSDLFGALEKMAVAVAFGNHDELHSLVHAAPDTVSALQELSRSFSGRNTSCSNTSSLDAEEWIQLHTQIALLSSRSAEVAVELVLFQQGMSPNQERLNQLLDDLDVILTRVMFGSFEPAVAAPPSQNDFDHVVQHIDPALRQLRRLSAPSAYQGNLMAGLAAEDDLQDHASTLQAHFLKEALLLEPSWPGYRVHVALKQMTLAREVLKEWVLATFDLRTDREELELVTQQFQEAHVQLKNGGDQIPAILLPERQDLLDQWTRVDIAWHEFLQAKQELAAAKVTAVEASLGRLVLALEAFVSLLRIPDVEDDAQFPWAMVIYAAIGGMFLCCCGIIVCKVRSVRSKKAKTETKSSKSALNGANGVRDEV